MAKSINITSLLTNEQPTIQIGDDLYPIDNSVEAVMRFEELAGGGGTKALLTAIEGALGKEAYEKINVPKLALPNLKVLTTAIMASSQNMTYEDAAARFQQSAAAE